MIQHRGASAGIAVAVAMLALGLAALPVFLLGALSVQVQDELGSGASQLGLMFSTFFIVAAGASALMGSVSERLGPKSSLRAATFVSACALLGIGGLGHSYVTIGAFIALAGISGAMVHPATNMLLVQAIPRQWLGFSFGLKQSGIPLATLLGGLAVPAFGLTVGWRWAFIAGACLALLVSASVPSPAPRSVSGQPVPAARQALPVKHIIVLSVGLGCGTAGATSLGAFAVPTMVDAGISAGVAGFMFALASCFGIATRIIVGLIADRRPGDELPIIGAMLVVGCLGYGLIATGYQTWMYAAIVVAFCAGWGWLGLYDLAIVRFNTTAPGAATGVTKTGAFLGGIIGPSTLGRIVDQASFRGAWLVAALFAAVAAMCMLWVAMAHRGQPIEGAREPLDEGRGSCQ